MILLLACSWQQTTWDDSQSIDVYVAIIIAHIFFLEIYHTSDSISYNKQTEHDSLS